MAASYNTQLHEYRIDGKKVPGVTEILSKGGLVDFSGVRADVLESARKFGVAVHKAVELWDRGVLDMPKLSHPLVTYLTAWGKFKDDYKVKFTLDDIELQVYSQKWQYAGRLDRICPINGKLTVVDIKSSDTITPVTAIQTAGYGMAYTEMTGKKIKQRWCVQLTEAGYKVTKFEDKTDEAVFIACLQLVRWKERNLK